jgi:hypothetical protein
MSHRPPIVPGGQQDSPLWPHVVHDPEMHIVTRVSQHAPAAHALPAQQALPTAPQESHVPLTQVNPFEQVLPEQHA